MTRSGSQRFNLHGLTHVVSLSEKMHQSRPIPQLLTSTYLLKMRRAIPPARFNAILDAISNNIRRGKVLVHCGSGISRAPIMVAAYLHYVGYKEFDAALQDIALLRGLSLLPPF